MTSLLTTTTTTTSIPGSIPYGWLFLVIPMGIIICIFLYIYFSDCSLRRDMRRIRNNNYGSSINTSDFSVTIRVTKDNNNEDRILFIPGIKSQIKETDTKFNNKFQITECPICQEPFDELKINDTVVTFHCDHSFCGKCANTFLKEKTICPLCNEQVGKIEKRQVVFPDEIGIILK